jgi:hypothetical protein
MLDAVRFATVNPMQVVVVALGTVYTLACDVPTAALIAFLKVLAIGYPSISLKQSQEQARHQRLQNVRHSVFYYRNWC